MRSFNSTTFKMVPNIACITSHSVNGLLIGSYANATFSHRAPSNKFVRVGAAGDCYCVKNPKGLVLAVSNANTSNYASRDSTPCLESRMIARLPSALPTDRSAFVATHFAAAPQIRIGSLRNPPADLGVSKFQMILNHPSSEGGSLEIHASICSRFSLARIWISNSQALAT